MRDVCVEADVTLRSWVLTPHAGGRGVGARLCSQPAESDTEALSCPWDRALQSRPSVWTNEREGKHSEGVRGAFPGVSLGSGCVLPGK